MRFPRVSRIKREEIPESNLFKDEEEPRIETYSQTNPTPVNVYSRDPKVKISKKKLIQILKEEEILRKSSKYQAIYDNTENPEDNRKTDVLIQKHALRNCNFSPDEDDSLFAYQYACGQHFNDPQVNSLVIWMRMYDKFRLSKVQLQQTPPDIELYDFNQVSCSLSNWINQPQPFVVVVGSFFIYLFIYLFFFFILLFFFIEKIIIKI